MRILVVTAKRRLRLCFARHVHPNTAASDKDGAIQRRPHAGNASLSCHSFSSMCMRPQTKKKSKPEVILDRNTRNKKKCVTTVYGLDGFGIKLSDAAKLFAKKYAGGAAVTKTPTDKEQIDVQVTFDFSLSFLPAD